MNEQFHFFWSGFLSQWHKSAFTVNSIAYSSCEQYMMAEKARVFGDFETRQKIMATNDVRKIKALGREVAKFDAAVWDQVKSAIVYTGNYAKFTQDEDLKKKLLATGVDTLVEASPYDRIWGIGLEEKDPRAKNRATWLGENLLGQAIQSVRDRIRAEEFARGVNPNELW